MGKYRLQLKIYLEGVHLFNLRIALNVFFNMANVIWSLMHKKYNFNNLSLKTNWQYFIALALGINSYTAKYYTQNWYKLNIDIKMDWVVTDLWLFIFGFS